MEWWSEFQAWVTSAAGSKIFLDAILPFVAIVLAGIIAAAVGRGSTRRVVEQHDREISGAAVIALIVVGRKAAIWSSLGGDEKQHIDSLMSEADIRVRLLPINGASTAADWAAHELGAMKTNSASQPYYTGSPACSPGPEYCGGYLNPSSYAAYASYLEDFVTYFANNGVKLYGISMQNEPDYSDASGENYESCSWTPQQMDAWIASLTAGSTTNPITTKLIMPESYNFNQIQSNPTLADANAEGNVSIIAGHLYGVTPSYATNAEAANKDVWMTEHSLSPSGSQPAIGDALALAEEIHYSMTVGYYNAYVYWWIWDNPADSINYGLINSSTSSPAPTYYGYAIGQFARFIQPGFVRVSATANPVSGVYLSAYNGGSGHDVIVAINAGSASANLFFSLQNTTVASLTPYQTTSASGMVQQTAVSVSSGQFSYTLPAQSIVTFNQQ